MGYLVTLHTRPLMAVGDLHELIHLIAHHMPNVSVEIADRSIILAILLAELPSREGWTPAEEQFFDGLKLLGFLVGWERKAMGMR